MALLNLKTEYIKKDGNIEEIFFPKYSPDQNPQEHVWKTGREQVTHNNFIPKINTKNKLKRGKSPLALSNGKNIKFDWMTFIKNQPFK